MDGISGEIITPVFLVLARPHGMLCQFGLPRFKNDTEIVEKVRQITEVQWKQCMRAEGAG